MHLQINEFLQQQHIATVCCLDDQINPYCFNCMYVFDQNRHLLYFKSAFSAHHSGLLVRHPMVSGTVLPDKLDLLSVLGIQFTGRMFVGNAQMKSEALKAYHAMLPQTFVRTGEIFVLSLNFIKMTDGRSGKPEIHTWNRNGC